MKIMSDESSNKRELLVCLREAYCSIELELPDWTETLQQALLSAAYGETEEENGYTQSLFKIEEAIEQMEEMTRLLKKAKVANNKVLEDNDINIGPWEN